MYAACRDTFGHKLFIAPQILGDGEVGSCARSRVFCFASPHAAKLGSQNKTARELYVSFVCVMFFWSMRLFGMEFLFVLCNIGACAVSDFYRAAQPHKPTGA